MSAVAERSWVEKVEEAVLSQFSSLFHDDRARALDCARSLGFEPLAVLPMEIWNQICQRFELYRFKMRNGQTYSRMFYPNWLIPCAALSAGVLFFVTLKFGTPVALEYGSFLGLAAVVFSFAVLFGVIRYFGQLIFLCLPKKFLLRKLWPNMVSEFDNHDALVLIPVSFKTDELFHDKEITLRKKGVGYWVASMPEAIQLRRVFTAEKMFEACPVLYLEDNNCAIILAQGGDFPRETEAVEFAKMLAQGRFASEN